MAFGFWLLRLFFVGDVIVVVFLVFVAVFFVFYIIIQGHVIVKGHILIPFGVVIFVLTHLLCRIDNFIGRVL
uniref:Uncharacterized protein n=1 Tax=Planktothricoides sp. SpSt-374 TaxID=2282167 RepID=A0A7C3ZJJ8_9CYAN